MNRFFKFVSICALATTPLFAQAPKGSITVAVQEKGTAREQLAYARTLVEQAAAARQHHDIHVAVANAAGNLNVIERVWPSDRVAIAEAKVLLAQLYLDAKMTRNAAETADQAVAFAPGDHRLHAVAARAHARLGNKMQAARAFAKTLETFDARRGTTGDNLGALNAAASWFEKEKRPADAAASLRQAAALKDLSPTIRVTLRVRALEQAALSGDRGKARDDLARLREAHRAALGTSLTPAQRDLLTIAENAIKRFDGLQ